MTTHWIIFLLFSLVSGQEECGKIQPNGTVSVNIIGEEDVEEGRFPWVLGLEEEIPGGSGYEFMCGATLIDVGWAITSARCVENATNGHLYRVVAGDLNRTQSESTEQWINVAQVHIHDAYNFSAPFYGDNIALLELAQPALLSSDYIGTACLPDATDNFEENPSCYVTGWGVTEFGGEYTETLRRSGIDVVDVEFYCTRNAELGFRFNDDHICIADQAHREVTVCDGDFGGSLTCRQNGYWYLAGVLSHSASNDCNRLAPQAGAKVTSYLTWISDTMNGITDNDWY